jgi:hypothetical protein
MYLRNAEKLPKLAGANIQRLGTFPIIEKRERENGLICPF